MSVIALVLLHAFCKDLEENKYSAELYENTGL